MSARDVAVFSREAMQYFDVREMFELTQWTVSPVSGGKKRSWPSSCDFIRQSTPVFYTYGMGGKTGGTQSELSLMAFGGNNGYEYLTVVMGAPKKNAKDEPTNIAYFDARRLIRWGLLDFRYETMARKSEPVGRIEVRDCARRSSLTLVPVRDMTTVLGNEIDRELLTRRVVTDAEYVTAPIKAGDVLGTLELYLGEEKVGSVPVAAAEDAPYNFLYAVWSDISSFIFSGWTLALLLVVVTGLGGYVLLNILHNRKKRSKKRKRK